MSPRSDLTIADIVAHPGLVLGWVLVGSFGLLLLWFMWPLVVLTSLIGGGYWLWRQQQREQERRERQQARLNQKFYELLQHRQGRISALELAMYTRLSGTQARHYLHQQAQALGAYFERTVHGDVIYIFDLAAIYNGIYNGVVAMTPAEVAWAYAERERAREHHYRTAQSARQVGTLRQLSAQAAIATQGNTTHTNPKNSANDSVITIDVSAAEG